MKSLGMTKEDENIPAADQSLEGMINEAFGTVAVTKLDDFKTGEQYWRKGTTSTMCDFHIFGLIFAGQCTVCLKG